MLVGQSFYEMISAFVSTLEFKHVYGILTYG